MKKTTKITVIVILIIGCFFLYFLNQGESLGEDERVEKELEEQQQKIQEERKKQMQRNNITDTFDALVGQGLLGTVIIGAIIISVVIVAFATTGRGMF